MAKRGLDGGRLQGNAVSRADGLDAQRLLDHAGRRRLVVEDRSWRGVGEDPAVEGASDDHCDPRLEAEREKLREAGLVEQRVAAGE